MAIVPQAVQYTLVVHLSILRPKLTVTTQMFISSLSLFLT